MARCSKKQRRAVISRRKGLSQRFLSIFQKVLFLREDHTAKQVKNEESKKLHRLGDTYTKCNRNPRKVGGKQSMHWCENEMLQVKDLKLNLLQTFRSLGHSLQSYANIPVRFRAKQRAK